MSHPGSHPKWLRHSTFSGGQMPLDYLTVDYLSRKDLARIFSKIQISTERFYEGTPCWEWLGGHDPDGYCDLWFNKRTMRTHRVIFAWTSGPIPQGCGRSVPVVDHLCNNRGCWCPWHLDLKTHKANILRGQSPAAVNARKTHCPKGHELSPENILTCPSVTERTCKTCHNEAAKLRLRRKNANRPRKNKALCRKQLHLLEGDNVYYPPNGGRECFTCKREKQAQYLANPVNRERARVKASKYYHNKKKAQPY